MILFLNKRKENLMYKIILFVFCFSFFNIGCQPESTSSEKEEKQEAVQQEENLVPENMTTAEPMICAYLGGPPFELDTISTFDSITNINFTAYFPQSNLEQHQKLNKAIHDLVMGYYKKHDLTSDDDTSSIHVDANIWVSNYSWNGDLVSFVFNEQDYYEGAAHYNHGFLSLCYDLKTNQEIKLTDFIQFKTGEAQKFCDAFNPDPPSSIHQINLEGKDFSKDRAFMADDGELVLYFSDAEKSPSMEKVYIPYSRIKGYINPKYQYLFEN